MKGVFTKMNLKKLACFALGGALLLSLSACATGPNTVVAKVNGENIYRWEVDYLYNKSKGYYEEASGIDLSQNSSAADNKRFRQELLTQLVQDTAIITKAKAEGYDLTAEEKTAVDKEYADMVERNIVFYAENDFKGDPEARKKGEDKWKKSLKDNNLTEEFLLKTMYNNEVHAKFIEDLYKEQAVDDEATLKETYEKTIEIEKEKYEYDANRYAEDAANPNNKVIYTPDGWVRVKMATMALPQKITEQIDKLSAEMQNLGTDMVSMAGEKGEGDAGTQNILIQISELDKQIKELQAQGKSEMTAQVKEFTDAAAGGMGMEELIEKYNDDPMMESYPYDEFGVLVSESSNYDKAFIDASLALQNPGDMSQVVEMSNGYTVVQLVEKVQGGTKSFEDEGVKDFIRALVVSPKKQEIVMTYGKNIMSEMDIVRYDNRL